MPDKAMKEVERIRRENNRKAAAAIRALTESIDQTLDDADRDRLENQTVESLARALVTKR